MGWADCGEDSKGRPIGYAHEATCDEPGCNAPIDHGLAYACGGMHGSDPNGSCEGYFCYAHLVFAKLPDGEAAFICAACDDALNNPEADEDDL